MIIITTKTTKTIHMHYIFDIVDMYWSCWFYFTCPEGLNHCLVRLDGVGGVSIKTTIIVSL